MEALTKEEMKTAKHFCKKETKLFWLCIYKIALNKNKLAFMW